MAGVRSIHNETRASHFGATRRGATYHQHGATLHTSAMERDRERRSCVKRREPQLQTGPAGISSVDQNGWAPLAVGKQYCIVFVCLARQILATISLMVLVERGWWSIVSVVGAVKRLRLWAFRERVSAHVHDAAHRLSSLVHKHAIRMSPGLLARCVIRGWVCLSIRPYRAVCPCSPCLKNVGIPVCANSSLLRTMYTGHRACVRAYVSALSRIRRYTTAHAPVGVVTVTGAVPSIGRIYYLHIYLWFTCLCLHVYDAYMLCIYMYKAHTCICV